MMDSTRAFIPTLRRRNCAWWPTFGGSLAVVGIGGWAATEVLLRGYPLQTLLSFGGMALIIWLMTKDNRVRWVQVGPEGVRFRFLLQETLLPWEEIERVDRKGWIFTRRGKFFLPRDLKDREGMLQLIRAVVQGEPLLPPSALPRPTWELLEEWFGPRDEKGVLRLNTNPNKVWERMVLILCLIFLVSGLLTSPIGGLAAILFVGFAFPVSVLCMFDRFRYPSQVLLDLEGVEFRYLTRRLRYEWSEILGATPGELLTIQSHLAMVPPDALTLQGEPLAQRLVAFVHHLRGMKEGALLLPPDDAQRALVLVSPGQEGPTGRELTEAEGVARGSGRDLEERRP